MTTFHYCIPSYTSTIRALEYSHARPLLQQNADSDNAYNIASSSGSNDGSCAEDLEVDNLSVKDIAALKLPIARLEYQYLSESACSTADNPSSGLSLMKSQIISSFHIARFTNVIGSLWPPENEACQKMAADFYSLLSKTDTVAEAYHRAVLALMKQKPLQPVYRENNGDIF